MGPSHPGPNPSSTYCGIPHPDIPPVPPLHHRRVVEQAPMLHSPAERSVSSGSTNQRTDSDAPSSDAPSPPTPKEGRSMECLGSPTGTHMPMDSLAGVMKEEALSGPLYYDYSEQFERNQYFEPEADPFPTGFVKHIKTTPVERETIEPAPKVDVSVVQEVVELIGPKTMEIAELPASPVPRRITRDMILAALETNSTDEDIATAGRSMEVDRSVDPGPERKEDQAEISNVNEEMVPSILQPDEIKDNRFSILSQAGSSIMESSTLDFAIRYSIPMAAGNGAWSGTEAAPKPESMTEDGMSDLLDGYQHTDAKLEGEIVMERVSTVDEPAERKSNHTPKSSDEQSFKSCTDLPDQPDKDPDSKSARSVKTVKTVKTVKGSVNSVKTSMDLPQQPFKNSDARSFKTCKDFVTPDRAVSMPPSRLPSSSRTVLETQSKRPMSETKFPSSPPIARKQPLVPLHESSFVRAHARLRANSKPTSGHGGSRATSNSSSINNSAQEAPIVPPRESSSSKEAQRSQAVADFLLRLSLGRRFSKTQATLIKKQSRERVPNSDVGGNVSKRDSSLEPHDRLSGNKSWDQPLDLLNTPKRALTKEQVVTEECVPAGVPTKRGASTKESTSVTKKVSQTPPAVHQYSMSTPSPIVPDPSSVYSPGKIPSSSSSKTRIQSSPTVFIKSPEHNRRDSTTHLVWHGRNFLNIQPGSAADLGVTQERSKDGTTTDLRLSAYRYPLHYLPDLKEESHEDSSLNTSASNLKNSNFRFPYVGQPSVRISGDDAFLCGRNPSRNPSTRSCQRNSLAQTQGLPSMNFSRMNLIEKLNEALDIRCSKSLDGRPVDVNELGEAVSMRLSSAGEIREKYRSFFASLDELEKKGVATQRTAILDPMPTKRQYSPVQLMAEIDKLSIPSVGGLTQRLSDLIPSLKEYYKLGEVGEFIAEEVIMEHALEEIHEVGGPAPKRSSARLRPIPGSPNMVVIDDALYDELTGKEKEHSSSGSSGVEDESPSKSGEEDGKGKCVDNAGARDKSPLAELEAPSPANLPTRSLSLGHHHDLRPFLESRLSSRRSLRSPVISTTSAATTDTRPWNSDTNYPWAKVIPPIDISLPSSTLTKTSTLPGPSRLRERHSQSSVTNASGAHANDTPRSPLESMSSPSNQVNSRHDRVKSLFRSLYEGKQSVNPHPKGFEVSGETTGHLLLREGDQPHDVGERYPFSALTPPANLHLSGIPENESSGDESSCDDFGMHHRYRKTTRLEYMKRKWKNPNRAQNAQDAEEAHDGVTVPLTRSDTICEQDDSHPSTVTDSVRNGTGESRVSNPRRQTYSGAQGMTAVKYHRKQLIAQINKIWHKTVDEAAKLGRRLSKRKSTSVSQCQTTFPKNVEDKAYIDADGKRRVPLTGSRGVALYTGV
jgi:serine/arginine repetitive matrix protein 2